MEEKSELLKFIERAMRENVTLEEREAAMELVRNNPIYYSENCVHGCDRKALYDTGLCEFHLSYLIEEYFESIIVEDSWAKNHSYT